MEQIGEILLPSCGAAVVTGIGAPPPEVPQVATCVDVYAPATANVDETITVEAYLKKQLTGEPLGGKTVYYAVTQPTTSPIFGPSPSSLTTDGNGKVSFTYTVTQTGVHHIRVVFLGEGGPFPLSVEEGFNACPVGIVSCLGEGVNPPTLPGIVQPPETPFPIGGTPIVRPGGILGQSPCGILCGSGIKVGQSPSKKVHGLGPG